MSQIIEITSDRDEQSFINNNPRAVVFFGSAHCGHCQHMKPIIEALAIEYPQIKFAHVEVSKVSVDMQHFEGVPLFVGYRSGNPVNVIVGADENAVTTMVKTQLL
jgi:thiol-disulfide isomerase/thioredoxin